MCGISVVLCKKRKNRAVHILLKSLEQLQNRGYDSFGMSCISQLKIHNSLSDSSSGSSSDISNLSEITNNDDVSIHDINDFVIENTIEKAVFDDLPNVKWEDALNGQISTKSIITEKDNCIYISALNKKNIIKILNKKNNESN